VVRPSPPCLSAPQMYSYAHLLILGLLLKRLKRRLYEIARLSALAGSAGVVPIGVGGPGVSMNVSGPTRQNGAAVLGPGRNPPKETIDHGLRVVLD
jgi:hypothetical protein